VHGFYFKPNGSGWLMTAGFGRLIGLSCMIVLWLLALPQTVRYSHATRTHKT
jgi:hypothetical protein